MDNALSGDQLRRLVEIMRERVPRPMVSDLISIYTIRETQHAFIDALEVLADETQNVGGRS